MEAERKGADRSRGIRSVVSRQAHPSPQLVEEELGHLVERGGPHGSVGQRVRGTLDERCVDGWPSVPMPISSQLAGSGTRVAKRLTLICPAGPAK